MLTIRSSRLASVNFLDCKSALVCSNSSLQHCLAVDVFQLLLFYIHSSPSFILVANGMTTLDAMTVGTITTVNGLDSTVVTIFLLLIGQKACNSDCDWFIQLTENRCPITPFCYWTLYDVRSRKMEC